MSELLVISNIDSCGFSNNSICLCLTCKKSLLLRNRPKFRIFNGLPCTDCQFYFFALVDLSMAKKAVITYAHLVVSILKLKPFGTFHWAVYSGTKGHAVLFLQNLAPLLTLFLFSILVLHNVIRIVLAGWGRPTIFDLRHFILVRKQTLLNTLT